MYIYVPITEFRAGEIRHGIRELKAETCRRIGGYIYSNGTIYGTEAYTDPEGVRLFWNKETWKADVYRYNVGEVRA